MKPIFNLFIFILNLCLFISACSEKKERTIHKGDYDLTGNFIKDTILDGAIKFYDTAKKLVAIRWYSNGILNGNSMSYYRNGNIHDSSFFINNNKNGFNYIFDSLGHLVYKANYYYGKQIGPVFTYNMSNEILEYSFNNFEDDILYYYSYDTLNKKANYPDDKYLIKVNTTETIEDGHEGVKVFLYIFNPPHLKLTYKICQFDLENTLVDSTIITKNKFYYEKFYKKTNDTLRLTLMLNKYDSLAHKEIVIAEHLKTSYP